MARPKKTRIRISFFPHHYQCFLRANPKKYHFCSKSVLLTGTRYTITGDHIKQDLRYAQKTYTFRYFYEPLYGPIHYRMVPLFRYFYSPFLVPFTMVPRNDSRSLEELKRSENVASEGKKAQPRYIQLWDEPLPCVPRTRASRSDYPGKGAVF